MPDKQPFINVYRSIGGWKAQMLIWVEDDYGGYWDVEQVSYFSYPDVARAIADAKAWAKSEEIGYFGPA